MVVASPEIIINYASMLEENRYFEDSFKIYERGGDTSGVVVVVVTVVVVRGGVYV